MIRNIAPLSATALLTALRGALFPALVAATMTASSAVHADSIVGGWGGSDSTGASALNLLPDGQYMEIEVGPSAGGGQSGIERGTYTWNPANGSFTNQTGLDTNGEWGLSDPDVPGVPKAVVDLHRDAWPLRATAYCMV